MKLVWILVLAFSALCKEISWEEYKIKYKLNFQNTEEALRREIFEENVQKIETENAKGHSYTLGINHFAHWTKEELNAMFMTPKKVNAVKEQKYKFEKYSADEVETVSEKVLTNDMDIDWRREGKITSVKDQGKCGSGYTFATTGNLESASALKGKALEDLSSQQVLDCGRNDGCRGGSDVASYIYLNHFGSMPWSSYPYTERKGPCKYNKSAVVTQPRYYGHETEGGLFPLLNRILLRPTTIRIHANVFSFIYYSSGIYNDPQCTSDVVDHMVIAVGYLDYYDFYLILKNSWGTDWGIEGYMKISVYPKVLCAVTSYPTYSIMP